MSAHALLSASSAHRWLNCPPSVRLTEDMPDRSSEYAEEGRLAHELAELRLHKQWVEGMGPVKYRNARKKLEASTYYRKEMDGHIETYYDLVNEIALKHPAAPFIALEKRLDFSQWVPEGFGTGDCIMIAEDTLYVIDFKYGQGVPVEAEENPQMMLYALGALNDYQMFYPIKKVTMIICQPRLDAAPQWETSVDALLAWGESIKPIAELALTGGGEYKPGDWCRFCKARDRCRVRSDTTVLEEFAPEPDPLITNAELADRIAKIRPYVKLLADLEELALSEALAGREVPGFKAVEGRSARAWTDSDAAFAVAVDAGINEELLYERKPLSLAAVEKLMGKKAFTDTLAAFVSWPPGKPTLAPVNDKRQAITARSNAEDDFNTEEEPENG